MKLRRLTLQGFKSFADRTELSFHDGITAVVGPNGCGKSNLSDAIRWVLGEQKASAIRGSKMEEAIFQGTALRRPLARAEVALAFDNAEGRLPLPHTEVEIRRIVFREGGSDYQLNRASTRLRDILDICRDTGLGANSYTVIEQGMVERILSDRPDERRHMFEEAAGIGRYKDRRKSALRRLEGAEHDLARLQDLVQEVGTKVRSLARQRGRAERYQEYRQRRLDLEIAVARAELVRVEELLAQTAGYLEDLTRDEPASRAALAAAETELERRRLESGELGRERNTAALRLEELNRMIAERERQLAVADERRVHAERRLVQISAERDELQARMGTLAAELIALEQERAGQGGVVETLTRRVLEVQERQQVLRQLVTDVRRVDEEARARENELTRLLARLESDVAAAEARSAECGGEGGAAGSARSSAPWLPRRPAARPSPAAGGACWRSCTSSSPGECLDHAALAARSCSSAISRLPACPCAPAARPAPPRSAPTAAPHAPAARRPRRVPARTRRSSGSTLPA